MLSRTLILIADLHLLDHLWFYILVGAFSGLLVYLIVARKAKAALAKELDLSLIVRERTNELRKEVSDRSAAEAALFKTNQTLETIIAASPAAIIAIEPNGKIILWNEAAGKIFGWRSYEAVGQEVSSIGEFTSEIFGENLDRLVRGEKVIDYEAKRIRKDGSFVDVSFSTAPIRDRDNNVVGIVGIILDITDIKRLREQLIQADKLSALGQLVSGVAHELNNPLTAIIGYASLLLANSKREDASSEKLQVILQEAERARNITRGLLSFARQHKPGIREIDLNSLLKKVLELSIHKAPGQRIKVKTDFEDLPLVLGDESLLQQVFLNIIVNAEHAMKATKKTGTLIVKTRSRTEDDDRWVIISIKDTGPGIPKELQTRVFEPFFTTKPEGEGTGLGLSISYGIVKEHGGDIILESEGGSGTTMIIRLPAKAESLSSKSAVSGD